jgi:hypothetical protein
VASTTGNIFIKPERNNNSNNRKKLNFPSSTLQFEEPVGELGGSRFMRRSTLK